MTRRTILEPLWPSHSPFLWSKRRLVTDYHNVFGIMNLIKRYLRERTYQTKYSSRLLWQSSVFGTMDLKCHEIFTFNPLTPNSHLISNSPYCLSYSSCDVSLENLLLDQLIIPNWYFSLFSSLACLILYWYCKEKFCLGHSWELKG